MPLDLGALLDPSRSALLLMECQEGVIGEGGKLSALAEAVKRHGTIAQIGRVLAAARAKAVPVFHARTAAAPSPTVSCWRRRENRSGRCCRGRRSRRRWQPWRRWRASG